MLLPRSPPPGEAKAIPAAPRHTSTRGGDSDDEVYRPSGNASKRARHAPLPPQLSGDALLQAVALAYGAESAAAPHATQPASVTLAMKPHQLHGLGWLQRLYTLGKGGILGDEMGVGKTLQAISLIAWLCDTGVLGLEKPPALIVVPLSTLSTWEQAFAQCAPSVSIFSYHGDKARREELRGSVASALGNAGVARGGDYFLPGSAAVLLTTPELLHRDDFFVTQFGYPLLIVDEGHRYKNPSVSEFFRLPRSSCGLHHVPRRYLMTGTPLQNNVTELWSLLSVIAPPLFTDVAAFQAETKVNHMQGVLRFAMLRRLKEDVLKELPPKSEYVLHCPMSPLQGVLYKSVLKRIASEVIGGRAVRMQNTVMQLRKCCSHPYLFPGVEREPYEMGEHLVLNSGKLVLLDKLLRHLKAAGRHVLVFSQFTSILDILQDYLNYRGWRHERLDGSMRADARTDAVAAFKDKTEEVFVFLLSTRAGGLGLNLTEADTVVFFDSDWNPQVDKQAQERVHRMGQTRPVEIFRLSTEGTVEDLMLSRSVRKMQLAQTVMEEDAQNATGGGAVKKGDVELQALIRVAAAELLSREGAGGGGGGGGGGGAPASLSLQDFSLDSEESCKGVCDRVTQGLAQPGLAEEVLQRARVVAGAAQPAGGAAAAPAIDPNSTAAPVAEKGRKHMVYAGVDYDELMKRAKDAAPGVAALPTPQHPCLRKTDVVDALLAGKATHIHACTISPTGGLDTPLPPKAHVAVGDDDDDDDDAEPAPQLTPFEAEQRRRKRHAKKWAEQHYVSRAVVAPNVEGYPDCAAARFIASLHPQAAAAADVDDDALHLYGLHHVLGDATRPDKCPKVKEMLCQIQGSTASVVHIVVVPVDNSGSWGSRGVFRSIDETFGAGTVSRTYTKAKQAQDLRLGDLHLVKLSYRMAVALTVVLRQADPSQVSVPLLSGGLEKVRAVCDLVCESGRIPFVHVPRFGRDWYTVEKQLANHLGSAAATFIYYHKKK